MALSVVVQPNDKFKLAPGCMMTKFTITTSGSYNHAGDVVTPNQLGLSRVDLVVIPDWNGYSFEYNLTDNTIFIRQCAAAGSPFAEISGAHPVPFFIGTAFGQG